MKKSKLKDRLKENYQNRDKGGGARSNKAILDFSGFDSDDFIKVFYKPKKGSNAIDIIPFRVTTDKHPDGVEGGEEDYRLPVWVHRFVGPSEANLVCLKRTYGKPCPICEEAAALRSQGDEDAAKKLNPSQRVFYNVVNLNEESGIQIFDVSHFLFEKELLEEAVESANQKGEDLIDFVSPDDGQSIVFRASEKKFNNNSFFEYKSFGFEEREESYADDIVEDAWPLDSMLIVKSYEEVRSIFYGIEQEEKNEESPNRKPKRSVKKKIEEEPKEQSEEKSSVRKIRKGESKQGTNKKCPYGHVFGRDNDKYEDCESCEVWAECADDSDIPF